VEACTLMALRIAKATDYIETDEQEQAFARVATPMSKYFNCSRAPAVANEALQCHGGNGFILEHPMARLFRESPLNSVWEGTANMMCMDVRRSLNRVAGCRDALFREFDDVRGMDARFDAWLEHLPVLVDAMMGDEFLARPASDAIARAVQGAELLRCSTDDVIDAFMETRLVGSSHSHWGTMFGSMGSGVTKARADRIVERATVTNA